MVGQWNRLGRRLLFETTGSLSRADCPGCIILVMVSAGKESEVKRPRLSSIRGEVIKGITPGAEVVQRSGTAEDRLRLVIDAIPVQVTRARPDGSLDFINHRWLEFLGVSVEVVQDCGWTTVTHPEDLDRFLRGWRSAMASGEPCEDVARVRRADGEYRWLLIRAVPLRDDSGNIVNWYSAAVDIEDRKRAEEEVRRREAYLTQVQRLSHTGSFGWKPNTGEIVWSDETYRIFEYDRSVKPTIDSVMQRVHPQDRTDFQKVIDGASRGATDFEHTYRLLLPDGRVKHVHAIAHALQDASGNREFVGAVTDITEHKTAEEASGPVKRTWRKRRG